MVTMIKACYMNVWKCPNEAHYFVQLIDANNLTLKIIQKAKILD
jgi:hypothetical protein